MSRPSPKTTGPPPPPPPPKPKPNQGSLETQPVQSPAMSTRPVRPGPPSAPSQNFALGRYQLLKKLGAGTFGVVWLAQDTRLNRRVALKLANTQLLPTEADRQAFLAEARAAAAIDHPNICTVYDCDEFEDQCFIAMAYVAGDTLRQVNDKARQAGQPISLEWAVRVIRDIAAALQTAHQTGIVHRDIKPANILLAGSQRTPIVTDFGLAREMQNAASQSSGNGPVGTPAYMSPEQITGKRSRIGPAADVYSLGICLYELIAGRLPFDAPPPQVYLQHVKEKPVSPAKHRRDCDAELARICLKTLAKKPQNRYPSMQAFADDLNRWLARPSIAGPVTIPTPSPQPQKVQRGSFAASALWILTFLVALGVTGWFVVPLVMERLTKSQQPAIAEKADRDADSKGTASDETDRSSDRPSTRPARQPPQALITSEYQLDLTGKQPGLPPDWEPLRNADTVAVLQGRLQSQTQSPAAVRHPDITLANDFLLQLKFEYDNWTPPSKVTLKGHDGNPDFVMEISRTRTADWLVQLPDVDNDLRWRKKDTRDVTLQLKRVGKRFLFDWGAQAGIEADFAANKYGDFRGVELEFANSNMAMIGLEVHPLTARQTARLRHGNSGDTSNDAKTVDANTPQDGQPETPVAAVLTNAKPADSQPTPPANPPQTATAHVMNLDLRPEQLQPEGWQGNRAVTVLTKLGLKVLTVQGEQNPPATLTNSALDLTGDFYVEWEAYGAQTMRKALTLTLAGRNHTPDLKLTAICNRYFQTPWSLVVNGRQPVEVSSSVADRPVWFRLERRGEVVQLLYNGGVLVSKIAVQPGASFRGVTLGLTSPTLMISGFRCGPLGNHASAPTLKSYRWQRSRNGGDDSRWKFATPQSGNANNLKRFELPAVHLQKDFRVQTSLTTNRNSSFVLTLLGHGPHRHLPISFAGGNPFTGAAWSVDVGGLKGQTGRLDTQTVTVRIERAKNVLLISFNNQIAARYQIQAGDLLDEFRGVRIDQLNNQMSFNAFELISGR